MKKYLLFAILLPIYLFSQEWINISPFSESNRSVNGNFISEDEGWAYVVGMYLSQELYHTADGGEYWDLIYNVEDSLEYFIFLQMIDEQNGWATKRWQNNHYPHNSYDSFVKTINGGYSWIDMTEHMPITENVDPFYFINQDVGFFCAGQDLIDNSAVIYKTIDGGYNWYLTETPIIYFPYPYNVNYFVNKFFFLDENHGWAACSALVGSGLTISTSDGGDTWEAGMEPGPPDVFDIHFVNPDFGGVACRNQSFTYLAFTEDNFESFLYEYNGSNWNQLVRAVHFQNDSTVWVTGEPGIINRSTDGGETFEVHQTFGAYLKSIQFFNNTGYIYGSNNKLLKYVGSTDIENDSLIETPDFIISTYPNPFNPSVTISFAISEKNMIELSIYNIRGQLIRSLINIDSSANNYTVHWDGKNDYGKEVQSGLYLLRLRVGEKQIVKKLMMMK